VLWGYPFSLVRRLILSFAAVAGACFVGAWVLAQPADPADTLLHVLPVALAILISMYVSELLGVTERPRPRLRVEAVFAAIATACFIMAAGYAMLPTYAPSLTLLCSAPVLSAAAVFLQRRWTESKGIVETPPAAVFAHDRAEAQAAIATLSAVPRVRVRAVVLPESVADREPIAGVAVRRPSEGLDIATEEGVRYFLVARRGDRDLRPLLAACVGAGYLVESVDELIAKSQGRVDLHVGAEIPLLSEISTKAFPYFAQRCFDVALAGAAMLITLPAWIFVAAAVAVDSKGPVLFRQERVGLWGQRFDILKFRTMTADAETASGPVWAQAGDARVTRVGRFLRAARLDELPQLWNVVCGDMSLVGPRPERPFFVDRLRQRIPLYDARHCVRPGLTGWAQIRYPYGSSEHDSREKLSYDLFYILNRSLTFYFAVLLETVKVLVFRRGSR